MYLERPDPSKCKHNISKPQLSYIVGGELAEIQSSVVTSIWKKEKYPDFYTAK